MICGSFAGHVYLGAKKGQRSTIDQEIAQSRKAEAAAEKWESLA